MVVRADTADCDESASERAKGEGVHRETLRRKQPPPPPAALRPLGQSLSAEPPPSPPLLAAVVPFGDLKAMAVPVQTASAPSLCFESWTMSHRDRGQTASLRVHRETAVALVAPLEQCRASWPAALRMKSASIHKRALPHWAAMERAAGHGPMALWVVQAAATVSAVVI